MPNWTSNRIEAPAEVLKKYISKDENGKDHFDFNLVIPRPEIYDDPDLVSGGDEEGCIKWYLSERGTKKPEIINPLRATNKGLTFESLLFEKLNLAFGFDRIPDYSKEEQDKCYERGRKYVEAIKQYGYKDWYDWSYANWGTKWNACDSCVDWVDDGWVEFETAWCVPMPIIKKIMKDNPDCEIRIIWSDEDYDGTHTYEHDGHGMYREYTVFEKRYEEEDGE